MALLLTILGIGLLLLIHEAGHYFAARAVGIRVLVFSLGFGPRIVSWTHKDCEFRLSWIPLGGYVRVAGEDPHATPQPGDLFYANAPRRLVFYAGGIFINFLFAFLLIPVLFFVGVPFEAPIIGALAPGEPAWEAGLQPGDRILQVEGRSIYGFRNVHSAIALAPREAPLNMLVEGVDQQVRNLSLTPHYDTERGYQGVGITPQMEMIFQPGADLPDTQGAKILRVEGISVKENMLLAAALEDARRQGRDLTVDFEDASGHLQQIQIPADPIPAEQAPAQIGISPLNRLVAKVRGPLAEALPQNVELLHVNQRPVRNLSDVLLAAHAYGAIRSLQYQALASNSPLQTHRFNPPLILDSNAVAADLYLTSAPEVRYGVYPGSAADHAGLKDGCRILRVDGQPVRSFEELRSLILSLSSKVDQAPSIELDVMDASAEEFRKVSLRLAPIPSVTYALSMQVAMENVATHNLLEAMRLGFGEAVSMVQEVLTTVRRMTSGSIASKNLGGIITIGTATHSFATQGLIPLLFFLCMISVNLGVLNLLPIPALDGGHILFALFEILVRRPVSMAVQNAFQVVGVFIVLFFLIFVTTLDIQRLFHGS